MPSRESSDAGKGAGRHNGPHAVSARGTQAGLQSYAVPPDPDHVLQRADLGQRVDVGRGPLHNPASLWVTFQSISGHTLSLGFFSQALYAVQPRRAPGFAFHWFDVIGHHDFIARHLSIVDGCPNPAKASAIYAQLVFCHMRFMAPFLQSPPLSDVINRKRFLWR